METRINALLERIQKLEEELEAEIHKAGERLSYSISEQKVHFEDSVAAYHKSLRKSLYIFLREASVLNILTAPVVYSMILPLALIDFCVTIYQAICFPVYGIKKVPRSDFIVLDRGGLEYLNAIEKMNCIYCGYANGLASYLREVAGRTEEYWCPIKHASRIRNPHSRYHKFVEYGDAKSYQKRMKEMRK